VNDGDGMATTFVWDGTANSWFSDHWGRAGVAPKWPGDTGSTVDDSVTITTALAPTDGPGEEAPLTIGHYLCAGNGFGSTDYLTVTRSLELGTLGGADAPFWTGAAPGVAAIFKGASSCYSSCGDYSTFYDDTIIGATTGDHCTFNDRAGCWTAVLGAYCRFYDQSYTAQGTTTGDCPEFHDATAANATYVGKYCLYNSSEHWKLCWVDDFYEIRSPAWWYYDDPNITMGTTAELPAEKDVLLGVKYGRKQVGKAVAGGNPYLLIP
jgi:hypothetical protein